MKIYHLMKPVNVKTKDKSQKQVACGPQICLYLNNQSNADSLLMLHFPSSMTPSLVHSAD